MPVATGGGYSIRLDDAARRILAIDRQLQLPTGAAVETVELAGAGDTYIHVLLDGSPEAGMVVELSGADSPTPYLYEETNEFGETTRWTLVNGSRARARVGGAELWSPRPMIDILPGRNRIDVYRTGTLTFRNGGDLSRVRHVAFDSTVQEWADSGLVEPVARDGTSTVRVPVGEYRIARIGSEDQVVGLLPGSTLAVD